MKWKPCLNKDCKFYVEAECELRISQRIPRKALIMEFGSHENIAVTTYGSGRAVVYPCTFCKDYDATKFDVYKEQSDG